MRQCSLPDVAWKNDFMMRVILNPMARGGIGARLRPVIERELHAVAGGLQIVETEHPGHATALARQAVADGVSTIVAAGGDGTLHEVANGIVKATESRPNARAHVALGIIPIGTGNDFAKAVPGVRTREMAFETLRTGERRMYDVGRAEWGGQQEYFLNAMGTGIDVEVVRQIERLSRGGGALVYLQGLLRALTTYRAVPLRITADGEEIAARVMLIAVANGSSIGGTFRISPKAQPDDGILDLCIVEDMPLLAQLALVPRIVRGTHESSPRVRTRQVKAVTLSVPAGATLFFQLDGELREPEGIGAVRVTIEEARLQIVAAKRA
jgi:YegS/Rv2252/BmrU family lipid kinase